MARDMDCRSYMEIVKEYYGNVFRLDTKAGVSLLFI